MGLLIPGLQSAYEELALGALRELGYTEGNNVVLERGYVAPENLPAMARELVRRKVDVIWAGSSASVRAAVSATKEIPIIGVDLETDPVASGYVASLARPGGNLTGFFLDLPEFTAKRLEVLREALPNASGVTVLWDPSMDRAPLSTMHTAAHALKLRLVVAEVQTAADIEDAVRAAAVRKREVIMVMQSPRFDAQKDLIVSLGTRYRLAVVAVFANYAAAGALLSYGPNVQDMTARSAIYIDRVLRGANAGDLPIQRPSKFDLVVNSKVAKSLGLAIAQSILLRADEVIQ